MAAKLTGIVVFSFVVAEIGLGCPTCMSAGGEAVRGLFWSMLALFLTVLVLLSGLAGYFWFLVRQAKASNMNDTGITTKSHTLGE